MTPPARPFLLVGLTGGIATGKSTACEIFRRLGAVVIDADALAREVVEPGRPAHRQIVAEFGQEVLRADGTLDRARLGDIVFADAERRRRLEGITHPAIRARLAERLAELAEQQFAGLVVFDAALMVETGNYRSVDRLVVVVTDEATQVRRLMARDGIGREEAVRRIRSQMPVTEKARLAHYVIDNSGDRSATEAATRRVHQALASEDEASRRIAALSDGDGAARPLVFAFPVTMGTPGQHELNVPTAFRRLTDASREGRCLAYHPRRSGNFVFHDRGSDALEKAVAATESVTGLRCLGRRFPDLVRLDWMVPATAHARRGSVVVATPSGMRRLIAVFLSREISEPCRFKGPVRKDVEIHSWPSGSDVLCFYQRPGEAGNVGQATNAVLRALHARGVPGDVYGTGRAMGVIRDLLGGRRLRRQ